MQPFDVVSVKFDQGENGQGECLELVVAPPTPLMVVHVVPNNPADLITPVDWSTVSPPTREEVEADLARIERRNSRPLQPTLLDTTHESFVVRVQVKAWLGRQGLGVRTARKLHFAELLRDLNFPPEEAVIKALDRIESESHLQRLK